MQLRSALSWIAVASAAVAAGLWLWSAKVRLPDQITVGYGGVGGSVQTMADALRRQSRLSAAAAVAAGVSSFAQALGMVVGG
jgi:hypothetical protein